MFAYRIVVEMADKQVDGDEPALKLTWGIIKQAVLDVACEHEPEILESAISFLRSPHCKGLCDTVGLNYLYLLQLIHKVMEPDIREAQDILSKNNIEEPTDFLYAPTHPSQV